MADTKVYYFDEVRGRGEFLRMVLTAAGQKFEDNRIKRAIWISNPDLKKDAPFGQLPYVIYNGKKHGQSIPLASYFGKKFGFYGKTIEDALRQEEVMHLVEDIRVPHIREWYSGQDAAKKAAKAQQLRMEVFPKYLGFFEGMLAQNGTKGYFVGDSVTMADMYLYDFLETVLGLNPQALDKFPLLTKMFENVKTMPALKTYLATKPKTNI